MKSRFLILSLLLFALATVPAAAGSGGFKEPQKYLFPKDLNTFFVAPDQPAVIELQLKGMPENSSLRYEMSDYAGKVFRKGSAMAEKGELRLRESFPRGLTDLSFPELNQRIGVYAFDAFDKVEDGYWGVNSVFSSMVYSRPGQPRYRNGIFAKPETIRQHMRLLRWASASCAKWIRSGNRLPHRENFFTMSILRRRRRTRHGRTASTF